MERTEVTAKTVDLAIEQALKELNATREQVKVYVAEEGSRGLFGLGAKDARVIVSLKSPAELAASKKATEAQVPEADPRPAAKPKAERPEKPAQPAKPADEGPKAGAPLQERPAQKPISPDALKAAQAFLTELIEKMSLSCTVAVSLEEGKLIVSGEDVGVLIGRRGDTIDAVQYLVNLHVHRALPRDDYRRITVDTENYRARREETLKKLAHSMANKVVKARRDMSLEPMNPYERRIIHAALQGHKQVSTKSVGEEPNRRVVVMYNKK